MKGAQLPDLTMLLLKMPPVSLQRGEFKARNSIWHLWSDQAITRQEAFGVYGSEKVHSGSYIVWPDHVWTRIISPKAIKFDIKFFSEGEWRVNIRAQIS